MSGLARHHSTHQAPHSCDRGASQPHTLEVAPHGLRSRYRAPSWRSLRKTKAEAILCSWRTRPSSIGSCQNLLLRSLRSADVIPPSCTGDKSGQSNTASRQRVPLRLRRAKVQECYETLLPSHFSAEWLRFFCLTMKCLRAPTALPRARERPHPVALLETLERSTIQR